MPSAAGDFAGVVVAAGAASRFGGPRPKQFCELGGATVLERAVAGLVAHPAVRGVVVVLAPERVDAAEGRTAARWPGVLAVVAGGDSRAASVSRGLAAAGAAPFVLVHDAARPLVSTALIDAVVAGTRAHGACVPGLTVADTVKEVDAAGRVVRTLDRAVLRLAQTPQGARTEWLRAALAAVPAGAVTDESAALEAAGRRVVVVAGEPSNRKITSQHDLEEARRWVREEDGRKGANVSELRVGTGFDVHRLGAERMLVLGGVEFPGEPGLVGHSDADVVLHAAMDAVLGAAALGDIGMLFPPDDERWKGADSRDLARDVAGRVRARGARIVNLDVMLLAERPRIGPRRERMRAAIAECFGVAVDRVGLKATTLEKLGALGRAEGIACEAVALVEVADLAGPDDAASA